MTDPIAHYPWVVVATAAAATLDTGPGGGFIAGDAESVTVTSASANNFVVLSSTAPRLRQIWLNVGANGFKLQTLAGSTQTINNVDTSSTAVAVIPANATCSLIKSLSTGWILTYYTNLGAVGTAIVPA